MILVDSVDITPDAFTIVTGNDKDEAHAMSRYMKFLQTSFSIILVFSSFSLLSMEQDRHAKGKYRAIPYCAAASYIPAVASVAASATDHAAAFACSAGPSTRTTSASSFNNNEYGLTSRDGEKDGNAAAHFADDEKVHQSISLLAAAPLHNGDVYIEMKEPAVDKHGSVEKLLAKLPATLKISNPKVQSIANFLPKKEKWFYEAFGLTEHRQISTNADDDLELLITPDAKYKVQPAPSKMLQQLVPSYSIKEANAAITNLTVDQYNLVKDLYILQTNGVKGIIILMPEQLKVFKTFPIPVRLALKHLYKLTTFQGINNALNTSCMRCSRFLHWHSGCIQGCCMILSCLGIEAAATYSCIWSILNGIPPIPA